MDTPYFSQMSEINPPESRIDIPRRVQQFLSPQELDLLHDSLSIISFLESVEQVKQLSDATVSEPRGLAVHDYAFVVFSAAKAYEGFLKSYLYALGLIPKHVYNGRFFRIGRSLNPDLPDTLRDEDWLYDDVARHCDAQTARYLWQTWLEARNHLFHFYPHDRYEIDFQEAQQRVSQVLDAMDQALACSPLLESPRRID